MTLFVIANHMLVVYCVGYAAANSSRAFQWMNGELADAIAIAVFFWLLSIWLLIDSVLYYSAFLDEMDSYGARAVAAATAAAEAAAATGAGWNDPAGVRARAGAVSGAVPIEGTGILSATAMEIERSQSRAAASPSSRGTEARCSPTRARLAVGGGGLQGPAQVQGQQGRSVNGTADATSAGATSGAGASANLSTNSFHTAWHRWTRLLLTEVGLAYALNILGSLGYVLSSSVSFFLLVDGGPHARAVDRAALWIDLANMLVFSIDGILFFKVWWNESQHTPNARDKIKHVYFWANLCNTGSSVFYLASIAWALHRRRTLSAKAVAQPRDDGWYDEQLNQVIHRTRSLFFASDLVYLLYSVLIEIGWKREQQGGKRAEQTHAQEPIRSPKHKQIEMHVA